MLFISGLYTGKTGREFPRWTGWNGNGNGTGIRRRIYSPIYIPVPCHHVFRSHCFPSRLCERASRSRSHDHCIFSSRSRSRRENTSSHSISHSSSHFSSHSRCSIHPAVPTCACLWVHHPGSHSSSPACTDVSNYLVPTIDSHTNDGMHPIDNVFSHPHERSRHLYN